MSAVSACQPTSDPQPVRQRVNAVSAPKKAVDLDVFCDARHGSADKARPFQFPELTADPPALGNTWSWVNLWATWCKPCIEEMPMMHRWQQQLRGKGGRIAISFISVDEDQQTLISYQKNNPQVAQSTRVEDIDKLAPWFEGLGLNKGAAIPIHIFVDPKRNIRCVRAGGLQPHHFDSVRAVVGI